MSPPPTSPQFRARDQHGQGCGGSPVGGYGTSQDSSDPTLSRPNQLLQQLLHPHTRRRASPAHHRKRHQPTICYYITDPAVTVLHLIDGNANTVASYSYDPYGNMTASSNATPGPPARSSSDANRT